MIEYKAAVSKLYSLELFGIKLGLQNLSELLDILGNPHRDQKFIHVAGTNGKGSVCAIISKVLEGAGFNVGFFSSPHLVTVRERFRFNNCGIAEEEFTSVVNEVWPTIEDLYKREIKITFFEATVAIALIYYKRRKCDFIVWETGMGGRLDGTNIVEPIVTAITTINYDHQQYLGNTLEEIASEKAGIIKKGSPVFIGDIHDGAFDVIIKRAEEKGSRVIPLDNTLLKFTEAQRVFTGWDFSVNASQDKTLYSLPMPGLYQKNNMTLAYSVLRYLSETYGFDLWGAMNALENIRWHARCQVLPDGKILDGAHNQEGINALVNSISRNFPGLKFTVIFGCLEERSPRNSILQLSRIAERFIFTPINSSRKSYEPIKITELMREVEGFSVQCIECNSAREALLIAGISRTLIAGSLYLAGEILSQYYTEDKITKI